MSIRGHAGTAGRVLDFGGFPGRWEILETAEETGGERFETRMELDERSELPAHVHPNAEESYGVVAGELEVQIDGEWSTVSAGERRVVPPRTEHAFRNPGPATVINIHRPALRFEEFFRRFHALKTGRGVPMPPDGLRSAILLAMLLVEYEDEQVAVSPPHRVFEAIAWVGSLLGYPATASPTDGRPAVERDTPGFASAVFDGAVERAFERGGGPRRRQRPGSHRVAIDCAFLPLGSVHHPTEP